MKMKQELKIFNTFMTMKTSKYIIPALLLMAVGANAQTVDQNVTVEREYQPVIQDAGKISSVPEIIEPAVEKTAAKYTEFNLPLPVGQNIHTLSAAELEHQRRKNPNGAFVRVGLGNYLNNMVDFALPVVKKTNMRFDMKLNHLATFSKEAHSTTNAALMFDNYFKKMDLYAGIGLGHEYFKYYGDQFDRTGAVTDLSALATDGLAKYKELNLVRVNRTAKTFSLDEIANSADNDVFWRFNTYVGVRSLPNTTGLRYLGEVQYKAFDSRNGLTENIIHSKAHFNTQNGRNRLGLDIEMQNMMYKSDIDAVINVWDSYTVFSMNPYYSIERNSWNLRLGVKSSFSFVHGRPFNPSPDISAEWKAVPKWLAVYAGVEGGYNVNTLDGMFTENRFLYSDLRVKDTYTPLNAYIGVKVKPAYNVLLDAYVNYRYIDNQYFFVNKDYAYSDLSSASLDSPNDSVIYSNRFNAIYSEASLLKIGVRANYNIRNLINIQLKGAYNGWKVFDIPVAWNKPKFEADIAADWRISRNLNISANVFFESERFAKLGDMSLRMRPKVDINMGASYSYLNWFTMFAKINNLINNPYQDFYGYEVQGTNVMVGAAFSF